MQVDKLKAIPIQDVARSLGIVLLEGKKSIECFKGHDKRTKSLSFNYRNNYFKCFGCGIAGSTINLVMEYYGCDFKTASKWLVDKFIERSNSFHISNKEKIKSNNLIVHSNDYQGDPQIYRWVIENAGLSTRGLRYLQEERGFSLNTIEYFQLKDIVNPKVFLNQAKEVFGLERLLKCGLWKTVDQDIRPVWWHHTVVFPFLGLENKINYIQGRFIDYVDDKYRYVNLNGVSSTIFNEKILINLRNRERIYLTEGISDAIWLHQKGLKSLGVMGAANFKDKYALMLQNYDIYVVPDNDMGGKRFFNYIKKSFHKINKTVTEVVFNKSYKDISDYFMRKHE